jgi:serine/threonine protein kinase
VSHSTSEPLRRWDPERIGPYAILGRLGAGAMGQVYLGRSAAGRLVAVKTIRIELAEEVGFRTRFAQEVAAARRVSGVFTASVVEADPEADLPWLATAYVPAPSLNRLVQACGPLPVRTVNWLAAGCAEALQSIHGAGLVHRDLKPSNVLVAPDGPRVIDFGVARAAERLELSVTRGAVGTPAYMAPEQARDTRQASAASDVWSLGATLVFAATGHPPYQGETVTDVLVRLATEPPDLSGLPDELTELITACMHRIPRMRPASSAMLSQLGPFTEAPAGAPGGHSYLPAPALALIGEYQRSPQLIVQGPPGQERGEDATSASYTALPASFKPAPRRRRGAGQGGAGNGSRSAPRRRRTKVIGWVAGACVGAGLITLGVFLGASLTSSGSPAAGPPPLPNVPPACSSSVQASSTPRVCMNQAYGQADDTFVVHGSGFAPQEPVTLTLSGVTRPPANKPITFRASVFTVAADGQGIFSYTVNQNDESVNGPLPLGLYEVDATGRGGHQAATVKASTQFVVLPPGAQGPPPP